MTAMAGFDCAPVVATIKGRKVILYRPFWNETTHGRMSGGPINFGNVPQRYDAPFAVDAPLLASLQLLPGEGKEFLNAMRIDVLDSGDRAGEFVDSLASNLVRHFRFQTGQWWLGHFYRETESAVRAAYEIDEQGTVRGLRADVDMIVRAYFGTERALTCEDFTAACRALEAGRELPLHRDVIADAIFFFIAQDDIRRSMLEACVSVDLAILSEAIRAGAEIGKSEQLVRHKLSTSNQLFNLHSGLPALFGTRANYRAAEPQQYELLRKLWQVRGVAAHGQVPNTGEHGRARLPERAEAAEMLGAAYGTIAWLESLPIQQHATE